MKKFSIVLFAALLIACEKEEEVEPLTIVGKWQMNEQIVISSDTNSYNYDRTWEFKPNGEAIQTMGDSSYTYSYSVNRDSLFLDHENVSDTWRRRFELESNTLEIHTLVNSHITGIFFYGIEKYDRIE